ncbi:hypothetical protein DVH24_036557 [Malus domestica]|uniref:Photosystem II reaction center protein Z n=1 Tax=Malus domestica TaxID=3750 RepID=A0A498IFS8_MALDO|nr:hypothetical protein DVH24_036557 [Malus domestica]
MDVLVVERVSQKQYIRRTIFWLIKGSNGIILLLKHDYCFPLGYFCIKCYFFNLLISVRVAFASPEGWWGNKNVPFFGTSLCIGLVFLVGILNSLIS